MESIGQEKKPGHYAGLFLSGTRERLALPRDYLAAI
jgi:hypothetical protein